MRRTRKRNWLGFCLFMVFYALLMLVAAAIGYRFLWTFCDNYEQSTPSRKMNEYVASLNEKRVKKLSVDFVESLDHNIQGDEESYAEIWKCFTGGVKYRLLSSNGEKNSRTYSIYNNAQQLGTVTIVSHLDRNGDQKWTVEEESYDFSFLIGSQRFIVPEHWVVMCGQRRLGVEYIIDPRIHYSFLEDFYGQSFPMPYLVEYEIGNYIGDPKVTFFDPDGMEQAPFVLTDGRDQMPRASKATSRMISAFTDQFLPLYIECLANVNHTPETNFARIRPLLVQGSEIESRLKAAIGGQIFAQSKGVTITGSSVNDVFDLGNTFFLIDLSFTVDTITATGNSITDTDMYLVVNVNEDVVKAVMVMLY